MPRVAVLILLVVFAPACARVLSHRGAAETAKIPVAGVNEAQAEQAAPCGTGEPLRLHFYDVAQGLAVLIDLPDGQHILYDTGDNPHRKDCGDPCEVAHDHLMTRLADDLGNDPIAMLWISHQHSDHIGGASDVLETYRVENYVDNGRDQTKPMIIRAREAAKVAHARITVIGPQDQSIPIAVEPPTRLTAIVPAEWPLACTDSEHPDPNDCSIGLRIDYCESSVLLTGDAEKAEEDTLDTHGAAKLLQLGHHGSDTSSGDGFVDRVSPHYAVVSAGRRDEGMNLTYCHPRKSTIDRVNRKLTGDPGGTLEVFDAKAGVHCDDPASKHHWEDLPVSGHLWATERDGDVVLGTRGDGIFTRE